MTRAGEMYVQQQPDVPVSQRRKAIDTAITPAALTALAMSLQSKSTDRYRLANSSGDGHYTLEVDGSDVACSCRGFEFRGQCKHSRTLKDGIAGKEVPGQFEKL